MSINWKIGTLSEKSDCPVQTIRYYEREGLLPTPERTAGNYRSYKESHLERLLLIRSCRSLEMTLEEIRTLLRLRDAPNERCGEVNALLDAHIERLSDRIAALNALEQELIQLRRKCGDARVAKDCGILNNLTNGKGPMKTNRLKAHHVLGPPRPSS